MPLRCEPSGSPIRRRGVGHFAWFSGGKVSFIKAEFSSGETRSSSGGSGPLDVEPCYNLIVKSWAAERPQLAVMRRRG